MIAVGKPRCSTKSRCSRIGHAPMLVPPPEPFALESSHKVSRREEEALPPNVRQNSLVYVSPPTIAFDWPSTRYTSPQTTLSRRVSSESLSLEVTPISNVYS